MTMRLFQAAVLISFVACVEDPTEPPAPLIDTSKCADEVCTDTQRCDRNQLHCVPNLAPTLKLFAPLMVVTSETFQIKGMASDDEGVTSVEWRVGDGEWLAIGIASDGAISFDVASSVLDNASMKVSVRAKDGRLSTEQAVDVMVDRVPPTIEQPLSSIVTDSTQPMKVAVTVHDGSNALSKLSINDKEVDEPKTDRAMSVELPSPQGDRQDIKVVVIAKDIHGNEKTQTFTLVADTVGPELHFVTPTAGSPLVAAPSFKVEVGATDLSSVHKVRLSMNDGGQVDAVEQDGGTWTADFALPDAEQQVTFLAEAIDAVGNLSSLRSEPLQVDRVPPTVAVTGPDVDSIHKQAFTVSATTNSDAVNVAASILGAAIPMTLGADGVWRVQTPALPMMRDYSEESFFIIARDAAGNETRSAARRVFIDTKPPQVIFTSPAANARFNISNFSGGNNDVLVSWNIVDADPLAGTANPNNGNIIPILSFPFATQPLENNTSHTAVVVGRDRAGNATVGATDFFVDRVAPTVVSWAPAHLSRNVDPRKTTINFSERVVGPTTATDALVLSPPPSVSGSWDSAHQTWTSPDLTGSIAFDATILASLTDDFGNPIAVSSRRFHTATAVPSSRVLATDVLGFTSTSDADGVVTFAVETSNSGLQVIGLSPTTGDVQPAVFQSNTFKTGRFSLNASQVVDATLSATHRVASTYYHVSGRIDPITLRPVEVISCASDGITNGALSAIVAPSVLVSSGPGLALSQAPYFGETGTSSFATINNSVYSRGATSVTLGTAADLIAAQSETSWAAFRTSATGVNWNRYACGSNALTRQMQCNSTDFGAPSSNPTDLRAAMNLSGQCLVATWNSGGQRMGVFQRLDDCFRIWRFGDPALSGCDAHTSLPTVSLPENLRVAPFSQPTSNDIIGAYVVGGSLQLGIMNSTAACTNSFTAVGAPLPGPAPTVFEPVQVGNKPAVMYIDTANNLQLYVP